MLNSRSTALEKLVTVVIWWEMKSASCVSGVNSLSSLHLPSSPWVVFLRRPVLWYSQWRRRLGSRQIQVFTPTLRDSLFCFEQLTLATWCWKLSGQEARTCMWNIHQLTLTRMSPFICVESYCLQDDARALILEALIQRCTVDQGVKPHSNPRAVCKPGLCPSVRIKAKRQM